MNEEFDFYGMGIRHALDGVMALKKTAKEIEKEYGPDARMEFEAGVSVTIPEYYNIDIQIDLEEMTKGTKNFGVNGLRNNSYFGGTGISNQTNAYGEYNEPSQGRSR